MRHDAVVVGGSFAGLSAATYIARGRRRVCVLDTGSPRNRFATHSHGFLGQDGSDPRAMLAAARAQVALYPTVSFVDAAAVSAAADDGGFLVRLSTGESLAARKLVLAFGISDELPAIPGLAERWGRSVLHCPYCHGYEFGGRPLGVLHVAPKSFHQALLIAEWGPTTLYLNGAAAPEAELLEQLQGRGVAIEPERVEALEGEGDRLAAVVLADGRRSPAEALYLGPRTRLNSDIAADLGCAFDEGPFGPIVRTDALKATTVPGVFAAGDITRGTHNVTWACADGVTAGTSVHRELVFG